MKYLIKIMLASLLAAVWAETPKSEQPVTELLTHTKDCIARENVTREDLISMSMGPSSNPSRAIKCYTNCIMEKYGLIKDGALQREDIVTILKKSNDDKKVSEIVENCVDVAPKDGDKCDIAFACVDYAKNINAKITLV